MKNKNFNIQTIADISDDINGSVPCNFKNSTIEYMVLDAVLISPDTTLVHIIGNGNVAGGQGQTIMTLVFTKNITSWQVRALQNTLISSVAKKSKQEPVCTRIIFLSTLL